MYCRPRRRMLVRMKTDLIEISDDPVPGAVLKRWRKRNGLKQKKAAEWLGVPIKTYENWEQDHRVMSNPRNIRRLLTLPVPRRFASAPMPEDGRYIRKSTGKKVKQRTTLFD